MVSERVPGWGWLSKAGSRCGSTFLLTQPVLARKSTAGAFQHWHHDLRTWFHIFAALQETHPAPCACSHFCWCCQCSSGELSPAASLNLLSEHLITDLQQGLGREWQEPLQRFSARHCQLPCKMPGLRAAYFIPFRRLGTAPTWAVRTKPLNYHKERSWETGWQWGAWCQGSSQSYPSPLIHGAGNTTSLTPHNNMSKNSFKILQGSELLHSNA